jgi:hypothetical protein
MESTPNELTEGLEAEFFYTTNYPHRWSSGPTIHTLDIDARFERIESLERARELAEKAAVHGWGEDRCDTTFGVRYKLHEL